MKFSVAVSVTEDGKKAPEYSINTDLSGELSFRDLMGFVKLTLISTAQEVLKEEQAKGFDKNPVVTVDGKPNPNIYGVKPFGKIEYNARADMDKILSETYQGLLDRSPVWKGDYKRAHLVYLNNTLVAQDLASLRAWLKSGVDFKESDVIIFVNVEPYARKLERWGVTAQRSRYKGKKAHSKEQASKILHSSSPNGVYHLTSRMIRSKYKRNSMIKFMFLSGTSLNVQGNFKVGRKGKPGRAYLYPSIIISVKESGIV